MATDPLQQLIDQLQAGTLDLSLDGTGGAPNSIATSFGQMQAKVLDYLDRPELASEFTGWVGLFQAKLNRILRTGGGEAQATLTPDPVTGGAMLPSDYQAWRSVESASGGRTWPLDYATPDILAQYVPRPYAGIPRLFTIQGNLLYPMPSGVVTLAYYRGVPSYSDDTATDWVLAAHPDIYLYGILAEAERFLKNDERAAGWDAQTATSLNDMITADKDARWGRASIRMAGWTP